jgi:hypothetical protein
VTVTYNVSHPLGTTHHAKHYQDALYLIVTMKMKTKFSRIDIRLKSVGVWGMTKMLVLGYAAQDPQCLHQSILVSQSQLHQSKQSLTDVLFIAVQVTESE